MILSTLTTILTLFSYLTPTMAAIATSAIATTASQRAKELSQVLYEMNANSKESSKVLEKLASTGLPMPGKRFDPQQFNQFHGMDLFTPKFPIPGKRFDPEQLKNFRVVEKDPNVATPASTGDFFMWGWRKDYECDAERLFYTGYLTEHCFGATYNNDDDTDDWGYNSFMYHCDGSGGYTFSTYASANCSGSETTYDLDTSDACPVDQSGTGFDYSCVTTPISFDDNHVVMGYYDDLACGEFSAFDAPRADACIGVFFFSMKYTSSKKYQMWFNAVCSGKPAYSFSFPTGTCMEDTDDDGNDNRRLTVISDDAISDVGTLTTLIDLGRSVSSTGEISGYVAKENDDDDDGSDTTTIIIGVVVGVGGGCILIGGLAFFFMSSQKKVSG